MNKTELRCHPHRCSFDAPTGIRIQTETGLSRCPLPIGIWAQSPIKDNTNDSPYNSYKSHAMLSIVSF